MGENRYGRRYPSLFWPVILITAGILFLLSNLGYIDIDFWELWRLWPVLLILIGLDLIFGRRSWIGSVFVLLITLVVVGGVVVLLITSPGLLGGGIGRSELQLSEPLGGAERASLQISFASGELRVGALEDSDALIEADLDLGTRNRPSLDVSRSDGGATLRLGYPRGNISFGFGQRDVWDVRLSPQVGYELDASIGAGEARIDLTGLDIRALKVSGGAGATTIVLPEQGGFSAKISGGVGGLTLRIPEGMAARIRASRGLGALNVSDRFEREGDVYTTGDWDTNDNRVEVDLSVGVGTITVRDR